MGIKLGIVGSEGAKFTEQTEESARGIIQWLLMEYDVELVISGACHLGGIDVWAVEEARYLGLPTVEYPPKTYSWSNGYKKRNIEIAEHSDRVVCITVRKLPEHYEGMRFNLCYHCGTADHVKSGGCWTVKYAKKIGKEGEIIVV